MGGDYYDRDYYSSSNTNTTTESTNQLQNNQDLNPNLDPRLYSQNTLKSKGRSPIVFALDVTGSMGEWVKTIYDKLPMFYGQMIQNEYTFDPTLSFCAIGDAECSKVPLQISEFSSGLDIDSNINKIFLEGGGGGNLRESYELAAYFYLNNCELVNHEFPFLFITGDEAFFNEITKVNVEKILGQKLEKNLNSREIFKLLKKKFNVFHLRKTFDDPEKEKGMYKQWADTIGQERVLSVNSPKASIDVILGCLAITTGARTLEEYIKDMISRGQTNQRVEEVTSALILYQTKLNNGETYPVKNELFSESFYKPTNDVLTGNTDLLKKNSGLGQDRETYTKNVLQSYFNENVYTDDKNKLREKLMKIKQELGSSVPREFICPLTNEIFVDPVTTKEGTTFERFVISKLLTRVGSVCPVSYKYLGSTNVVPNILLRKMIAEFSSSVKLE
jgi:hypothetical protein